MIRFGGGIELVSHFISTLSRTRPNCSDFVLITYGGPFWNSSAVAVTDVNPGTLALHVYRPVVASDILTFSWLS